MTKAIPSASRLWQAPRAWLARHVLLLAIVFLAPAFGVTGWIVRTYHSTQNRLAVDWYRKGESDVAANRVAQAIDDYRAALAYSHDNPAYRLRLAQVLERSGDLDAASADLHRLWEDQPANSVINLELARLAARRGESTDAIRYYNNAIYGVWPADDAVRRRETQMELIDYLMKAGRTADARAGLIALAADAPPDAGLRLSLGDRLAATGDLSAALQQFREALAIDPHSAAALERAGVTAFRLGDFEDAERSLRAAAREGETEATTQNLLSTARDAVALDPFLRGLTSQERVRRVRRAFDQAVSTFGRCVSTMPATGPHASDAAALHVRIDALAPALASRDARDAQVQQDAMDLVFDVEDFASEVCGTLGPMDAALHALGSVRKDQP